MVFLEIQKCPTKSMSYLAIANTNDSTVLGNGDFSLTLEMTGFY